MNAEEFCSRVEFAGRKLPAEALKQAVDFYCVEYPEPFQLGQIKLAVQLAGRFAVSQAKSEDSEKKSAVFSMSARDVASSDSLCDQLEPEILALRREIFKSEKVPFRGGRAAVRWIEETSAQENRARPMIDAKELREAGAGLQEMTGAEITIGLAMPLLSYFKPGKSWVYRVIAPRGGQLCRLAQKCKSLSLGSGFSEAPLVWWVLRGLRPLIPRITFTRSLRSRGPEFITFTINGPLTWREAWCVFQEIQRNPLKKRRQPSPQHSRILRLAAKRGGVPAGHGRKSAFWESIRLDLEKEFGLKAPTTWQAVRKAYYALKKSSALTAEKTGVDLGVELSRNVRESRGKSGKA